MKKDTLLCGDSLKLMADLPDESVDMIFADPPYFMQLHKELIRPDATAVAAVTDTWDKFQNTEAYDAFTKEWLKQAYRVLKKTGTLWVIGTYHNIFRVFHPRIRRVSTEYLLWSRCSTRRSRP